MFNSEQLRALRTSKGLSQQYVADQLGVKKSAISKIELGRRNLSPKHVDKLAELYGVSPLQIITGVPDDLIASRLHELGDKPIEMLSREEYEYVFLGEMLKEEKPAAGSGELSGEQQALISLIPDLSPDEVSVLLSVAKAQVAARQSQDKA